MKMKSLKIALSIATLCSLAALSFSAGSPSGLSRSSHSIHDPNSAENCSYDYEGVLNCPNAVPVPEQSVTATCNPKCRSNEHCVSGGNGIELNSVPNYCVSNSSNSDNTCATGQCVTQLTHPVDEVPPCPNCL